MDIHLLVQVDVHMAKTFFLHEDDYVGIFFSKVMLIFLDELELDVSILFLAWRITWNIYIFLYIFFLKKENPTFCVYDYTYLNSNAVLKGLKCRKISAIFRRTIAYRSAPTRYSSPIIGRRIFR